MTTLPVFVLVIIVVVAIVVIIATVVVTICARVVSRAARGGPAAVGFGEPPSDTMHARARVAPPDPLPSILRVDLLREEAPK